MAPDNRLQLPVRPVNSTMRWLSVGLIGLFAATAAAGATPRFGVGVVNSDSTAYLQLSDGPTDIGRPLLLAFEDPPIAVQGWVISELKDPRWRERGIQSDPIWVYALRCALPDTLDEGLAVAFIGQKLPGQHQGSASVVHTGSKEVPFTVRECSSTEGIHLTVWKNGRRIWHEYYYLGFDVEPDCTDQEVGE